MNEAEIILHWDNYKEDIISFIKKRIKKSVETDDILQEVFIKYWKKNHEIKDKSKVRQWLLSVSRFTIFDYYREKNKDKEVKFSFEKEEFLNKADENIHSDESKKILPIIYGLPQKYKNILLLSDIFGIPHKDISMRLNLSPTCIRTRVIRARKLLSEKMKECCSFTHDKYGNIVCCNEKATYTKYLKNYKKDLKIATF
jgi:RNA polymerase sigma-70 factor (ECF subfamily)